MTFLCVQGHYGVKRNKIGQDYKGSHRRSFGGSGYQRQYNSYSYTLYKAENEGNVPKVMGGRKQTVVILQT